MEGSERHFRRTDEVEVFLGQVVDVLGRLGEKSGALHGVGLDKHGRYDGDEARRGCLGHREVEHRELQQSTDTGQVIEAGAGDLGTPDRVDSTEPLADLEVIARGEVEDGRLTDGLEHDVVVLPARGHTGLGDVGQPGHQGGELDGRGVLTGVGVLDLGGQVLGAGEQVSSFVALGRGDLTT